MTKMVPHKVLYLIPIVLFYLGEKSLHNFKDYHEHKTSEHNVMQVPIDDSTIRDTRKFDKFLKKNHVMLAFFLVANILDSFEKMRSIYFVWHIVMINNKIFL